MKPFIILFIILSVGFNLCAIYFVYKAYRLGNEVEAFRGYLKNAIAQNETLKIDFPGILNYQDDNNRLISELSPEQRKKITILYGASITKYWDLKKYFPDKTVLNRGVGGQNDIQLVARFSSDVINLNPGQVVIKFCSGNFNPESDENLIFNEFEMMTMMAVRRGIKPILATVIPATQNAEKHNDYSVAGHVKAFNQRILKFAFENKYDVVDYYSAMADSNGYLPTDFSRDELHPNDKGYEVMAKCLAPFLK